MASNNNCTTIHATVSKNYRASSSGSCSSNYKNFEKQENGIDGCKNGDSGSFLQVENNCKVKRKRRNMFDEEVDKYNNYEEYLDSMVTPEDHYYLEDEAMARIIAELGYRSSGDTLTRENFYKMKSRLAERRFLASSTTSDSDQGFDMISSHCNTPLVKGMKEIPMLTGQLKARAKDVVNDQLHTLLFIQTKVEKKNVGQQSVKVVDDGHKGFIEISGHIDLSQRFKSKNFLSYLNGKRRMVPKLGDLTFYNWSQGVSDFQSSKVFSVEVRRSNLWIKHCDSGIALDACKTKSDIGEKSTGYFVVSGWTKLDCKDEFDTYVYICDFRRI